MTSNLPGRTWQHKEEITKGFSSKYKTKMLIYYEAHDSAEAAITRERQMKGWQRMWKIELIEKMNSEWRDLSHDLGFENVA